MYRLHAVRKKIVFDSPQSKALFLGCLADKIKKNVLDDGSENQLVITKFHNAIETLIIKYKKNGTIKDITFAL